MKDNFFSGKILIQIVGNRAVISRSVVIVNF